MWPPWALAFQSWVAVSPMNGPKARMRLAASCGSSAFDVSGVRRLVGGGQGLDGSPEFPDVEGGDGAARLIHHRRGQIGREVVTTCDGLVHGLPTAHRVEAGFPDPMDGSRMMHLFVERIRILDVPIVEQCKAESAIHRGHLSQAERRRRPASIAVPKVAIDRLRVSVTPVSQGAQSPAPLVKHNGPTCLRYEKICMPTTRGGEPDGSRRLGRWWRPSSGGR